METLQISTDSKKYPVFLGANSISALAPFIKERFPSLTKILIITDHHVAQTHLNSLECALSEFPLYTHQVPSGEACKTFDVFYECLTIALEQRLDRKSLVIAFGGGAVGDLSGFVAASYMRGVPFIQVPTTILAHDSAVGGKVAINHPLGKNMIGAFYQPDAVCYDLTYLQTLPEVEVRSGFAEVIKHGLIQDTKLFDYLMDHLTSLSELPVETLHYCLSAGIKVKSQIVAEDEKETGVRAYLNFGHTLGHAIEGELGYGNMTHGEAIMIGTVFALRLSQKLAQLEFPLESFVGWLQLLGYQTTLPTSLNTIGLIDRMKQDKKSVNEVIQFVLLRAIGDPIVLPVEESLLKAELQLFMEEGLN